MTEEKRKEFERLYKESENLLLSRAIGFFFDLREVFVFNNDTIQKVQEALQKANAPQITDCFMKVLELCDSTDINELSLTYLALGDSFLLRSTRILNSEYAKALSSHYEVDLMQYFGLISYSPNFKDHVAQAVKWYKKAGNVLPFSNSSLGATVNLAVLIINKDWIPKNNERKTIESIFGNALKYVGSSGAERKLFYLALAQYFESLNDLIKVREYYEMGKRVGLDCESELEAIDSALGIANAKTNAMQRFIQRITFCSNLADSVIRKLKNSFGSEWNKLQKSSKECLTTGFLIYILLYKNFYAEGQTDMDYSSVIIPVMKAVEIEFSRIFFDRFMTWLQENEIPPERFAPGKCDLVEYEVKPEDYEYVESKDVYDYYRVSKQKKAIRYVVADKKGVFGIGKLKYWIVDNKQDPFNQSVSVNSIFIDYLDELFLPDAVGIGNRRQEIEEYLLTLTQKLSYLAGRIRNPAAHSDTMPFWKANYCCNVVVMVDRVLQNFIAKIKPEYLRSGEVMPKSSKKTPDRTT